MTILISACYIHFQSAVFFVGLETRNIFEKEKLQVKDEWDSHLNTKTTQMAEHLHYARAMRMESPQGSESLLVICLPIFNLRTSQSALL